MQKNPTPDFPSMEHPKSYNQMDVIRLEASIALTKHMEETIIAHESEIQEY